MNKRKLYTILLVSEAESDKNLVNNLQNNGFEVVEAINAQESKKILDIKKPHIILIDAQNQDFAFEILNILRKQEDLKMIPVIVISENDDTQVKIELLSSGVGDYIIKPFSDGELLARINRNLLNYLFYMRLIKENEKLKETSLVDQVTGLFNRKYLMNRVESEVSRAVRKGECISFVIIEIDNYDEIVNTYGYTAKDHIMKQVANMLKQYIRLSDIVVRYGETQLAVLCPVTDRSGLDTFVERVIREIQDSAFEFNDDTIEFTISMGAYTLESSDFNSFENKINNVIVLAEEALEKAKNGEGNKIEFY